MNKKILEVWAQNKSFVSKFFVQKTISYILERFKGCTRCLFWKFSLKKNSSYIWEMSKERATYLSQNCLHLKSSLTFERQFKKVWQLYF